MNILQRRQEVNQTQISLMWIRIEESKSPKICQKSDKIVTKFIAFLDLFKKNLKSSKSKNNRTIYNFYLKKFKVTKK